MAMNPITTGEQMLFAERDKFNRDDEPVRRGAYGQRYDGTVVRRGEDDFEAIAKPDRDFVIRAGENFEENLAIARIDLERARTRARKPGPVRETAPTPRARVEEEWERIKSSPAYRENLLARGIIRRRAA